MSAPQHMHSRYKAQDIYLGMRRLSVRVLTTERSGREAITTFEQLQLFVKAIYAVHSVCKVWAVI